MAKKNPFKKTRYEKRGDKLEVELRDEHYNSIYKDEVSTRDTKELGRVMEDLEDKGVPVKKAMIKKEKEKGAYQQDEFW